MKLPKLKDLVREQARFVKLQDGNLWYQVLCTDSENVTYIFDFPIPVDDADGGTFLSSDRAMIFMRWMRKHLEYLQTSMMEMSEGHG